MIICLHLDFEIYLNFLVNLVPRLKSVLSVLLIVSRCLPGVNIVKEHYLSYTSNSNS